DIVPLIDLDIILKERNEQALNSKKSVGILIKEPERNIEAVLLVDNIMNKIAIDNCEIFQTELGIATNTLSPIISGFFAYQGKLGMIMDHFSLFYEIEAVLKNTLSLKDTQEFSSTLLPAEIKFLEEVRDKRKELEVLLFYHHEGIRLDYFVFKLEQFILSIDVAFVKRVFSTLEWQTVDANNHPIIGIATVDNVILPVIDLAALIFNIQNPTELRQSNFFFLLEFKNHLFLVPVNYIEGVVTKFKEELIPCEETEIFREGEETCQYVFSYENIPSSIYIIENEFIKKIISKKDLDTLLKKIKNELNKKD
ncbi:MAG: chemotaxis protein CheW, partial [Candidatus Hodarchaeales archaeon]